MKKSRPGPKSEPTSRAAPLQAAGRLVSRLLFGHVALRRDKGGALCVTLAERKTADPGRQDGPERPHTALARALDACPEARRVFKHLHYLENELAKKGWGALAATPPKVLLKALTQLDALPGEHGPLAPLRERLAAAVVAREPESAPPPAAPTEPARSDFQVGSKVEVREASLSDFMRAAGHADSRPPQ